MKYTLSYKTKFGMISAESNKPSELIGAYGELKKLAGQISEKKFTATEKHKPSPVVKASSRSGSGETATILNEIETRLLNSNFFSKARTTGETKEKLLQVSHKNFTSRKVSQALGILRQKKRLRRSGARNFYAYSIA